VKRRNARSRSGRASAGCSRWAAARDRTGRAGQPSDGQPEPTPTPTPAAATTQDASRQDREQAPSRHLRLRHARHGLPVETERPELVRHAAGRRSCRPTPTSTAKTGRFFAGVRQSRLGVKASSRPTWRDQDNLRVRAVRHRVDAGQTTFPAPPRWGELGQMGPGQTLEPVLTPTFPELDRVLGPERMVFFRNVQLRWTPWSKGDSRFAIASSGPGRPPTRVSTPPHQLEGVTARFPLPDLSAPVPLREGLATSRSRASCAR